MNGELESGYASTAQKQKAFAVEAYPLSNSPLPTLTQISTTYASGPAPKTAEECKMSRSTLLRPFGVPSLGREPKKRLVSRLSLGLNVVGAEHFPLSRL